MGERDLTVELNMHLRRYAALITGLISVVTGTAASAQVAGQAAQTRPLFGRISDAKIVAEDRVVVVDEMDQRIWYLNAEGHTIATAGRNGAGPGEFLLTERLIRMDDSTLGVVDRRNARLTFVRVRRDTILTTGSIALTPFVEDACRLGSSLLLAIPDARNSAQVTSANLEGVFNGTLATLHAEEPPMLREVMLRSAIGCFAPTRTFVTASTFYPTVRAFDASGRQLWMSSLPNFRQVTVGASSGGGVQFRYRLDGNSSTRSVIPMRGDTLAVAVQIFWAGPPKDTATVIGARYLLSARTGRVLSHASGPERLLDVLGSVEAVMVEDPEPTVFLRRR